MHDMMTHLHHCPGVQARSDVEACERRAQELASKEVQLSQLATKQAVVSSELDAGDLQLYNAAAATTCFSYKIFTIDASSASPNSDQVASGLT